MEGSLERDIGAAAGAYFYRQDGEVMFAFRIDASSIIGPRKAVDRDQIEHVEAWHAFARKEAISPLDRDANGHDGGSLKKELGPACPIKPVDQRKKRKQPEPTVAAADKAETPPSED